MPRSWYYKSYVEGYDNSISYWKLDKSSFYDNSSRMPKSWYDKRYVEGYDSCISYWKLDKSSFYDNSSVECQNLDTIRDV